MWRGEVSVCVFSSSLPPTVMGNVDVKQIEKERQKKNNHNMSELCVNWLL